MAKVSLSILSIIVVITGSVLFFQWKGYSLEQPKADGVNAEQTITIQYRDQELIVEQTLQHLAPQIYDIDFPDNAKDIACYHDEKACELLNEASVKVSVEAGELKLSYRFEMQENTNSFLLENWTAKLTGVQITSTKIQVVDEQVRTGSWIAGMEKKGEQHLDFVSYFVFAGEGSAPPLYWQDKMLKETNLDKMVTLYHADGMKIEHISLESISKLDSPTPFYIVMTDQYPAKRAGSLIIMNDSNQLANLEAILLAEKINQVYLLPEKEKWLGEVIASLTLNQNIGTGKSIFMFEELMAYLSEDDRKRLIEKLTEFKGETIDSVKLDQILSGIVTLGTDFFTINKDKEAPFRKLVFYDLRPVSIKKEKTNDVRLTYYEQEKKMYPFEETMKALGYKMTEIKEENSFILEKDADRYRFYTDKNLFIFNEEDYGLFANPLVVWDETVYIEETWLQQLFHVFIDELENEINIE